MFCPIILGEGIQGYVLEETLPHKIQIPSILPNNKNQINENEEKSFDYVIKMIPIVDEIFSQEQNPILNHYSIPFQEKNPLILKQKNFQCLETTNHWLLLCQNIPFVEIISSLLVSELYLQEITPHFLFFGGFSLCKEKHFLKNTTKTSVPVFKLFYEKIVKKLKEPAIIYKHFADYQMPYIIDMGTYLDFLLQKNKNIDPKILDSMIISIFHSLFIIQNEFNMLHNDLHLGNIFISWLDEKNDSYSISLKNKKYFAYKIHNKTYYIPNFGWIIKIADLGFSSFSLPHFAGISQGHGYLRSKRILYYNQTFPNFKNDNIMAPDYLTLLKSLQPFQNPIVEKILNEDPMFQNHLSIKDLHNGSGPFLLQPKLVKSPENLLNDYYSEYLKKPENILDEDIAFFGKNKFNINILQKEMNKMEEIPEKIPIISIKNIGKSISI